MGEGETRRKKKSGVRRDVGEERSKAKKGDEGKEERRRIKERGRRRRSSRW